MTLRTSLGVAVVVLAAAAVIGGFYVIGSPGEARVRRLDDRRVSDLRRLQGGVNLYWTRSKKMPESLEAMEELLAWSERPVDPASSTPYAYRVTQDRSYELCAVFERPSQDPAAPFADDPFWSHASGRQCFPLTAKDLNK